MIVRRAATFRADFPDDGVVEDEWYVRQPGRNLTAAIAEALSERRYNVSGPDFADLNGWVLYIHPSRRQFWAQFSGGYEDGRILLVSEDRTDMFKKRRWPPEDAYPAFLRDLHAVLTTDPRFGDVRWFNFDKRGNGELDHGTEPVSDAGEPA